LSHLLNGCAIEGRPMYPLKGSIYIIKILQKFHIYFFLPLYLWSGQVYLRGWASQSVPVHVPELKPVPMPAHVMCVCDM
jgi:hypothetical protein